MSEKPQQDPFDISKADDILIKPEDTTKTKPSKLSPILSPKGGPNIPLQYPEMLTIDSGASASGDSVSKRMSKEDAIDQVAKIFAGARTSSVLSSSSEGFGRKEMSNSSISGNGSFTPRSGGRNVVTQRSADELDADDKSNPRIPEKLGITVPCGPVQSLNNINHRKYPLEITPEKSDDSNKKDVIKRRTRRLSTKREEEIHVKSSVEASPTKENGSKYIRPQHQSQDNNTIPHDQEHPPKLISGNIPVDCHSNDAEEMFAFQEGLRNTPEYRIAWDMELWKATQRRRAEKEIEEYRAKLQKDAKRNLLLQEKEIRKELDRAVKDLAAREKRLEEEDIRQEKRKVRLLEAEREMERRLTSLQDQRKRVEEDSEHRANRLKQEYKHREDISRAKLAQAEDACRRAEERLAASHKEYLTLWEEFSQFKTKQLTQDQSSVVAGGLNDITERLRLQHANEVQAMQERFDRQLRDSLSEVLRELEHSRNEIQRLSGQHSQKREQARQLHEKLEEAQRRNTALSRQLTSKTEYISVMHGISRHGQHPFYNTQTAPLAASSSCCAVGALPYVVQPNSTDKDAQLTLEEDKRRLANIQRWAAERRNLLENSGGAYTVDSDVIRLLDDKIRRAQSK